MNRDFEERIKTIEAELVALKTASLYSSVRSSYAISPTYVRTGLYRVTYAETGEPIMSTFYINTSSPSWDDYLVLRIFPRTPVGNTQVLEINTTYSRDYGQTSQTYDVLLTALSNRPITSITRIS